MGNMYCSCGRVQPGVWCENCQAYCDLTKSATPGVQDPDLSAIEAEIKSYHDALARAESARQRILARPQDPFNNDQLLLVEPITGSDKGFLRMGFWKDHKGIWRQVGAGYYVTPWKNILAYFENPEKYKVWWATELTETNLEDLKDLNE